MFPLSPARVRPTRTLGARPAGGSCCGPWESGGSGGCWPSPLPVARALRVAGQVAGGVWCRAEPGRGRLLPSIDRTGHEKSALCRHRLLSWRSASAVLAFCDMRTLYLRNVPDDVVARLERLAARDATSVGAVAVRELAEVSRRADNPALLGSLPDFGVDAATILHDLDAGRADR